MLKPKVGPEDNIAGDDQAPITLVEYGDYQCPHCGRAYPILKKIQEDLGKSLRFVFRNFPLQQIHPRAFTAAVATQAAARQQAYWQMHDIIFENQDALSHADLLRYAKQFSLDVEKFEKDLADKRLHEKVENDFESGILSGVNGTPTFFINGTRFNGNWEENELSEALHSLAKQQST